MTRLIDVDVLMKWFDAYYDHDEFTVGYISGIIREQPTVDAVPVRHGKWIEDAESYYRALGDKVDENTPYFTDDIACSVCLEKFNVIDNDTERWAFCPNCGARMEEDE